MLPPASNLSPWLARQKLPATPHTACRKKEKVGARNAGWEKKFLGRIPLSFPLPLTLLRTVLLFPQFSGQLQSNMGTGKKEATRRVRQGKTGDGMANVHTKGENFYR